MIDFSNLIRISSPNITNPTPAGIISLLLPYIFVLAGFAMLAFLVFGGYEIMTAGGDPKKMASGRGKIMYAIAGFLIIFVSYFVIQIVGDVLNIRAIQNIFGFKVKVTP